MHGLSFGVGSERKGAPYGETLQATGRTNRIFHRHKRVCADALPANSVASALPRPEARFLTGTLNLPWPAQPALAKGTFLFCWEGGHFYFALTARGMRLHWCSHFDNIIAVNVITKTGLRRLIGKHPQAEDELLV
jgi:hypothetical protein